MNTVVALDSGLAQIKNYLTEQGCQIINIDAAKNQKVDAIVLSGADNNVLGMEDIMVDAPVISADGMTTEEIWSKIKQVGKYMQ